MTQAMETFWVELEDRRYPITIGRGIVDELIKIREDALSKGKNGAVIIDEGLLKACPAFCEKVTGSLVHLVLPSGEATKSAHYLAEIWDFLAKSKIDRSGFLFALGGGVIGDLTGFAAATYLRGISFYQVPSTLLAMVDSSVGGKTGINLSSGKNLVGSFHQPSAVWADLDLLDTLPEREFSAGMAEVVKYGLLGDRGLFEQLLSEKEKINSNSLGLGKLIKQCCVNKAAIVEQDEREVSNNNGGRALLNLGHTFAHAIESVAGYGNYLHGEAVAIGMVCAWRLSVALGHFTESNEDAFIGFLHRYELPSTLKEPLQLEKLMIAMCSDKKVSHGNLRFILLKDVGSAFQAELSSVTEVREVWQSVGAVS